MNDRKSRNWVDEAVFASWWLTWDDFSWPDPKLTEKWKARADRFRERGINTVVMFGLHFRFDYTGYLDRVFGLLREIADICHDRGLRVVEHHSATLVHRVRSEKDRHDIRERNFHHVPFYPDGWDNQYYKGSKMADWRQVSVRDGKPVFFPRYTCECFCPNNPEYQRAYENYTRRHLEAVPVDAYMSDDLHYLPDYYSCGCEHCRTRFREEDGIELPPAEDRGFWENFENPDFLKWIAARYRWNGDFYKRLRAILPRDVLLWGCASDAIDARIAGIAYSPNHYVPHWDAMFHEIFHQNQPGRDDTLIASNLAAFAGLARHHDKPLIALFYARSPEEVPVWLKTVAFHGARPWLSRQPRSAGTAEEEELLAEPIDFPAGRRAGDGEPIGVVFSESTRDRLGPRAMEDYVKPYCDLCYELCRDGKPVVTLFDGFLDASTGRRLKAVYIPAAGQLSPEARESLAHVEADGVPLEWR